MSRVDKNKIALEKHEQWHGKFQITPTCPLETAEDLSIAYTPGVAAPCLEIAKNPDDAYRYTRKGNLVAVVTDGTAVLGLGNIGPAAGMPVMEGKAVLFRAFGEVDAIPLCLDTTDVDEIVETVVRVAPTFGGVNLEDIAAPRCFEIEQKLIERLEIPVFHDDQHGTAIVVLAALLNALKVAGKDITKIKAVVNGAGAAGIACTKLLLEAGLANVVVCDKDGALYPGKRGMNEAQSALAEQTNPHRETGLLKDAIVGADFFLGVSAPGCLTTEMVATMAEKAIVFAMANPTPEIFPEDAKAGGAYVVGTGRSDYPNQINNVLVFPGLFRGALDARATHITSKMKLAAAMAIANYIPEQELSPEKIIPAALDKQVAMAVAKAVAEAVE